MRSGFRAALGTAAILLALPAGASADTTTVDASASGNCARGGTCNNIQAAVNASSDGDAITVKVGSYTGDVTVSKTSLQINAERGAQLAGSMTVTGPGLHVDGLLLLRAAGSGAALTDSAGGLKLTSSVVAAATGPAISITGGDSNIIQRSTIVGAVPSADAISQNTTAAGTHSLTIDSSVIIGGAEAAGVRVVTTGASGDASLLLRHVTMPRVAKNGVVLDSTGATGSPGIPTAKGSGNITATIRSSIVHSKEGSVATNFIPTLLGGQIPDTPLLAANAITVTQTNSDANTFTAVPSQGRGPQINEGGPVLTSDFQLFDSTYHLVVGSPAIDKGGDVPGDEANEDVDGDPRIVGDRSDIGADEFKDRAPVAAGISASPQTAKSGQAITFTIDASDPDSGDVLGYGFNFHDGNNSVGTTKSVTHAFTQPGTYQVDGIVVDKGNLFSSIVSTTVTVVDGTAPQVSIGAYKLSGFRSGLSVSGSVNDASGTKTVELAITRLAGCRQFNGSTFAKNGGCKKYLFRPVTVAGNVWNFAAPTRLKLQKGRYQMRVRATDTDGNTSVGFRAKSKTLVAFSVK
jgi:hypothetical protein